MNSDNAYAAIVIPPGFTASLLSAYELSSGSAGTPTIQLLTNPRAGSIGVQLATGVAQPGPPPGIARHRPQALGAGRQGRP